MILSDALISLISQLQTQQAMTSRIRSHIDFNTDLLYSCTHFVVEIDEKSSHNGGFKYDLMMIRDSGLLFLGHPVHVYLRFGITLLKARQGKNNNKNAALSILHRRVTAPHSAEDCERNM